MKSNVFNLNGKDYDKNKLPPEGQNLLDLIHESQQELARIDRQRSLIQAGQQHLIAQLKPLLTNAQANITGATDVIGHASREIPTTAVDEPAEKPAPFPNILPDSIKA